MILLDYWETHNHKYIQLTQRAWEEIDHNVN